MISADTKDALARELPQERALPRGACSRGSRSTAERRRVRHPPQRGRAPLLVAAGRAQAPSDRDARTDAPRAVADLRRRAPATAARDPALSRSTNATGSSRCAPPFLPADRWRPAPAATTWSSSFATSASRRVWRGCCAATASSAKATRRKRRVVLYLKDFDAIAELLTRIGAFAAVLAARRRARVARDEKPHPPPGEYRGGESAAQRRRPAPRSAASSSFLQNAYGLSRLSPPLREVAELRLRHPDESLAELGRRCSPPIGKPTVSSRLRRAGRLADRLRGVQGSAKAAR